MDSWFFLSFPAKLLLRNCGSGRGEEPSGENPRPDSDPFSDAEFGKNLVDPSRQIAASANRRFKFDKGRQLLISLDNATLSIAAVCVCNPDRSPVGINRCNAAPTPSGFAEIVSDDFPVLYGCFSSQSFWKAGSARKGSQIGSSLRRAGVRVVG